MSFDKIYLKGITAKGYHGFYDKERAIGQNFVVDIVMDVDSPNACVEDNLERTVDYEKVGKAVIRVIEGEGVKLIETLAERIALVVLCFDGVCEVKVTVHKPQAPLDYDFEDVALTITRNRSNLRISFENSAFFIKNTNLFEGLYTKNTNSTNNNQTISDDNFVIKEDDIVDSDINPKEYNSVNELSKTQSDIQILSENVNEPNISEPEDETALIDITETGVKDFPPIFNPEKADVVLALGANLGDPIKMFQDVIVDLDRSLGFEVLEVSPLVKTKAHTLNDQEQPDYYNCVLQAKTLLSEKDLLGLVKEIEYYFGRRKTEKWEPRLIDIDIIKYNDCKYEDDELTIPHKLAKQRAFVLYPWNMMDSNAELEGQKVSTLLEETSDKDGILQVWTEWLTKTQAELELNTQMNHFEILSNEDEIRVIDSDIDIFSGDEVSIEQNYLETFVEEDEDATFIEKEESVVVDFVNPDENVTHDENASTFKTGIYVENSGQTLSAESSTIIDYKQNIEPSSETSRLEVEENVDEVLHTLEHTKVMNQLRTLFDKGVEDEPIVKINSSNLTDKNEELKNDIENSSQFFKIHKHAGNYETHSPKEKQTVERASIYEALRKKTFDEAMSMKNNGKNSFKPKWQSLELGE